MAARPHVSAGIATQIGVAALALFACALVSTASAYEQITHMVLSQQAFNASSMDLISFEYGMGAFGLNNDGSPKFQEYPATTGVDWDMYALVQVGAINEDSGIRPLNHFFNPVNNAALLSVGTHTSPDWALAPVGSIAVPGLSQTNSFEDARQYYWTALTASDPKVRAQNFGLLYQSLARKMREGTRKRGEQEPLL